MGRWVGRRWHRPRCAWPWPWFTSPQYHELVRKYSNPRPHEMPPKYSDSHAHVHSPSNSHVHTYTRAHAQAGARARAHMPAPYMPASRASLDDFHGCWMRQIVIVRLEPLPYYNNPITITLSPKFQLKLQYTRFPFQSHHITASVPAPRPRSRRTRRPSRRGVRARAWTRPVRGRGRGRTRGQRACAKARSTPASRSTRSTMPVSSSRKTTRTTTYDGTQLPWRGNCRGQFRTTRAAFS